MESRFLQQLELANVIEAVQLEDESRIGAGGHVPAAILVVIDELHPNAVIVLPFHFVGSCPVEPVRAVRRAARLIKAPQRRQCVLVVPLGTHRAHEIATRFVDGEGRIDIEVQLDQLVDRRVPLLALRRCGLLPQPACLPEAVLLVVVVVTARKILNRAIGEERLRKPVPMLHSMKAHARGLKDVRLRHAELRQVCRGSQVEFVGFVEEGT